MNRTKTNEIVEQVTAGFREDLNQLGPETQKRVRETLADGYDLLNANRGAFFAKLRRPVAVHLNAGLTASLYAMRVSPDLRVVLTVDHDPIFDRTLVTLFRVIARDRLEDSYLSTARNLYGKRMVYRNGNS